MHGVRTMTDRFFAELRDALADDPEGARQPVALDNGHSPDGAATHEIPESLAGRLRVMQTGAGLIGQAPTFVKAIAQLPAIAQSDSNCRPTGDAWALLIPWRNRRTVSSSTIPGRYATTLSGKLSDATNTLSRFDRPE